MQGRELVQRLKEVPIETLLERHGIKLKGRRFGPCPACEGGDNRACMLVNGGEGWYCTRCEKGGSGIDLVLAFAGKMGARFDKATFKALEAEVGDGAIWTLPKPERKPIAPGLPRGHVQQWANIWKVGGYAMPYELRDWFMYHRGLLEWPFDLAGWIDRGRAPREDLRKAAARCPCAVFPLRSTNPERLGGIENLVVRPVVPILEDGQKKPWKSKCLNWGERTDEDDGWPLAYADRNALTGGFRSVLLVEGALDWLTGQMLVCNMEGWTCIGAFSAGHLRRLWARYMKERSDAGVRFVKLPHLDKPSERYPRGEGVNSMADLPGQFFPWHKFLAALGTSIEEFRARGFTDLNDVVRRDAGMGVPWAVMARAFWGCL